MKPMKTRVLIGFVLLSVTITALVPTPVAAGAQGSVSLGEEPVNVGYCPTPNPEALFNPCITARVYLVSAAVARPEAHPERLFDPRYEQICIIAHDVCIPFESLLKVVSTKGTAFYALEKKVDLGYNGNQFIFSIVGVTLSPDQVTTGLVLDTGIGTLVLVGVEG